MAACFTPRLRLFGHRTSPAGLAFPGDPRQPSGVSTRRRFLQQGLCATAGIALAPAATRAAEAGGIRSIEKIVLRPADAEGPCWFHPRACMIPGTGGRPAQAFMTLQPIMGSDYFGPVHWTTSDDRGGTWSEKRPVPPLGWDPPADGGHEGVCDVVPEWHAASGSVLALGHNVFYRGPKFEKNQPPRCPVFAVWKDGVWGKRQRLLWDDPRGSQIYTNNCGQRVELPNGDVAMSFTFGVGETPRCVCGVRCSFDGERLTVRATGNALSNPGGRGLLEPSVTRFGGRFYLTLRAEDERGYVSVSDDGLAYAPQQAWAWDDGEPLTMSTTQQHWLTRPDSLWLVYTRKDASNVNVVRWRSPLFMARVDPQTSRLVRATERVVMPLVGDGVNDPDQVPIMGNFHTTNAAPDESWVTVGCWRPKGGLRGDLLMARITWKRGEGQEAGIRG